MGLWPFGRSHVGNLRNHVASGSRRLVWLTAESRDSERHGAERDETPDAKGDCTRILVSRRNEDTFILLPVAMQECSGQRIHQDCLEARTSDTAARQTCRCCRRLLHASGSQTGGGRSSAKAVPSITRNRARTRWTGRRASPLARLLV
jgi:hypothetical protein